MDTHDDKAGTVAVDAPPSIPELVAEVYVAAPPAERGRLLEQLLRPLGLLSLFGIAGGVFATLRLRTGWQDLQGRVEALRDVHAHQVAALVDHAQQVSAESVDGLSQILTASPLLSSTAATAVLLALLAQRARLRHAGPARQRAKF